MVRACNGTNRHNEIYRPRVNQPRETANSRGEKSVTGLSIGLQFHKWWGPAWNHFRFMVVFITMILVLPSRVHVSNSWFKYNKIQQYCCNGPWMCYIIYYETKYAKNKEDFLLTLILEIWEALVAPSRFVSVTKYWKHLDYILWHLQSRKSDNDDSSMGKVLLPCPWLDVTWSVRGPTILAMVRLWSMWFLLQVGRCYMEDHGAWQEHLNTHACWSTFVSERCSSHVTCISLECIICIT